jgi:hypothetical protein
MVAPLRELSRATGTQGGVRPRGVHTQGDKMSRNQILAAGALLWTVVIIDGLAHFVSGDWMAAVLMAIAGTVTVSWFALRKGRRSLS